MSNGEDPLAERLVASEVIFRGRVIELRVDTIERGDGRRARREVAGHRGAVAVLALDDAGRLVLVRQWRHPAGRALLEIPAGGLDVDPVSGETEDPAEAAHRELEEETGLRAGRLERLTDFWTAPGFTSERIFLYLAGDLTPVAAGVRTLDHDEALEIVRVPWREVVAAAERGEIRDAKSLVGILLLARRLGSETGGAARDAPAGAGDPSVVAGDTAGAAGAPPPPERGRVAYPGSRSRRFRPPL
jgi:ADP-ribose pyrophosphatase